MEKRRKSRSRAEWSKLCTEYETSGMTARAFAASRGVNASTLLWWRSVEAAAKRERGVERFVEVVEAERSRAEGARADVSRVTLRVGDVVVEVVGLPPAAWIRELAGPC